MDFRNAIKWYQYDPTKWFIWVCSKLGLASHLKTFPDNEIKKGELTLLVKRYEEGKASKYIHELKVCQHPHPHAAH